MLLIRPATAAGSSATAGRGMRHHGLGPLHTVTLAEAREKAKACRQLLIEGRDPIEEKRARKAAIAAEAARAITFRAAAETYINDHHAAWKNPKNRQQWQNTLAAYAHPVIGKLPVAEIDTGLVMRVLEPIWREKDRDSGSGADADRAHSRLGCGPRLSRG